MPSPRLGRVRDGAKRHSATLSRAAARRSGQLSRVAARRSGELSRVAAQRVETSLGGPARTRVILVLGGVLALSSADTATVGASATTLRHALDINNFDIGLLVAINALVAAIASIPFGIFADRLRRTTTLGITIMLWGACMVWSATASSFGHLLVSRLFLGIATASAGPIIASLIGDWFAPAERGRIYSYVLTGELIGAGLGFAVTGDIAALSWRAAFVILALPAFLLAWAVLKLPEPARGGMSAMAPGAARVPRSNQYGLSAQDRHTDRAEEQALRETDAQRIARERGPDPDPAQVLRRDGARLGLRDAMHYILSVRTNVVMIIASACGYYYLTGVETFGTELVHTQYGVNMAVANLLILVLGAGAVLGVLGGGRLGDSMLSRGRLSGRVIVAAGSATLAAVAFVPALLTHSALMALPYLVIAAFGLSAQNPPLDAARLDIMPASLWGRAEGVRTMLRTAAQALAPVLFGATADYVFGGHDSGLQATFLVMLVPLAASAYFLFRAIRTYPRDVATAAAARS